MSNLCFFLNDLSTTGFAGWFVHWKEEDH